MRFCVSCSEQLPALCDGCSIYCCTLYDARHHDRQCCNNSSHWTLHSLVNKRRYATVIAPPCSIGRRRELNADWTQSRHRNRKAPFVTSSRYLLSAASATTVDRPRRSTQRGWSLPIRTHVWPQTAYVTRPCWTRRMWSTHRTRTSESAAGDSVPTGAAVCTNLIGCARRLQHHQLQRRVESLPRRDESLKWSITCWVERWTLATHSLIFGKSVVVCYSWSGHVMTVRFYQP